MPSTEALNHPPQAQDTIAFEAITPALPPARPIRSFGRSLMHFANRRRRNTPDTMLAVNESVKDPIAGFETPDDFGYDQTPEEIAPTEETAARPEIIDIISNLMSEESILTEQKNLQARIDALMPAGPDEPKPRELYHLEGALYSTRLSPHNQMALLSTDLRAAEIGNFLKDTPRLERGTWLGKVHEPQEDSVVIEGTSKQPMQIPVSNIVDASAFNSWEGRGHHGQADKKSEHDEVKRTSAETIDYYAAMDSQAPPIETATAYVQPNGLVFFSAGTGNHRAAAAIKRGDELLAVTDLRIRLAKRNYF